MKLEMSGKRDSDSRPQPWQGCALPTELFPQNCSAILRHCQAALGISQVNLVSALVCTTTPLSQSNRLLPLCPRKDSNLHASQHTHLKRARLPIPPLGHFNPVAIIFQYEQVKRRRLELPRHNCHYPLKVARLPIPPPLHCLFKELF